MQRRVYIVSKPAASRGHRSRALLEFLELLPEYSCYVVNSSYLVLRGGSIPKRICFKTARILNKLCRLMHLVFADIIYIYSIKIFSREEKFFAKLLQKKIIADFYISKFDTHVHDRKTIAEGTSQAKKLLYMDQWLIDFSDKLIFLNKSERDYYLQLLKRESSLKKSHILPLVTTSRRQAVLPFANEQKDLLVLCWWGSFIPLHGIEKIIGSALTLKKKNIGFKIYLFGTSEKLSKPYIQMLREKNLSDCIIIDNSKRFSDYSLERFLAENCDIAFGNFGDSKKAKTVICNKIVEAASMAIPVISQKTSGLSEYFNDNESIFFTDPRPEAIGARVAELYRNKTLLLNVSSCAYKTYAKYFSKEAYIQRVSEILS